VVPKKVRFWAIESFVNLWYVLKIISKQNK